MLEGELPADVYEEGDTQAARALARARDSRVRPRPSTVTQTADRAVTKRLSLDQSPSQASSAWPDQSPDPYASPYLSQTASGSTSHFDSPILHSVPVHYSPPTPRQPSRRGFRNPPAPSKTPVRGGAGSSSGGQTPQPSLQSVSDAAVTAQLSAFLKDAQASSGRLSNVRGQVDEEASGRQQHQ